MVTFLNIGKIKSLFFGQRSNEELNPIESITKKCNEIKFNDKGASVNQVTKRDTALNIAVERNK